MKYAFLINNKDKVDMFSVRTENDYNKIKSFKGKSCCIIEADTLLEASIIYKERIIELNKENVSDELFYP